MKTTTYELLQQSRNEGLKALYERYGRRLFVYAVKNWSLNDDTAWDIIYKTLYRIAETHQDYRFESEEKFGSFTFKVFVNYLRNHYRDQQCRGVVHEVPFDDAQTAPAQENEDIPASPQLQKLQAVLDEFEDWERMLLLMRSQDMPYSHIARFVNKPEDQLKVYYQRLRKKLLDRMNQNQNSNPNA